MRSRKRIWIRRLAAAGIALFWAAMVIALARRSSAPMPAADGAEALDSRAIAAQWQDVEEWMSIESNGKPIGAIHSRLARQSGGEFQLTSRASLRFSAPDRAGLDLAAIAKLNDRFELSSFSMRADSSPLRLRVYGFVWAERLYLRFATGESNKRMAYYPLEGPVSLMEALRPLAARAVDLEPGKLYRIQAFDPIWFGQAGAAAIEIVGEETIVSLGVPVEATRMEMRLGGRKLTAWIGPDRSLLRYEMMDGLVFERMDAAEALAQFPNLSETPKLARFTADDVAMAVAPIDLSQGNAMGGLTRILMDLAGSGAM